MNMKELTVVSKGATEFLPEVLLQPLRCPCRAVLNFEFSILSEQTPESTATNSSALPTTQCRLFQGQEIVSFEHLPEC